MNVGYLNSLFNLENKKAIVTGGSQGIGRGIACSLAAFGAEVTVTGRNADLLQETVNIISAQGGVCSAQIVDGRDRAAIRDFLDAYLAENGRIDIFINNAGRTCRAELQDTTDEEVDQLLKTNLTSALTFLSGVAEQMKRQRSGNIVVITSVNGLSPLPGQGMYSVTKFALEGATKALASSLAEYGVRVNSCAPGAIDTAMNAESFRRQEGIDSALRRIPMNQIGSPRDIGDVVACLVSDACRYMTGATVVVDGGLSLKHR